MNQFFLYPFKYKAKDAKGGLKNVTATVLFCEGSSGLRLTNLSAEIQLYYELHEQTDELFVIGGKNINSDLIKAFIDNKEDTYRYIPKSNRENLIENTSIFTFDEKGTCSAIYSKESRHTTLPDQILNEGLLTIFTKRGGLIESNAGHHYIFPSGKHCGKFLRTGNILLHSAEIFFIAFTLLSIFDPNRHQNIYCDTSSINTLAFALQELRRRLLPTGEKFTMVPVDSFSSYEGLVKVTSKRLEKSLILISASTSANILQRINNAHPILDKQDMKILFYLGPEEQYSYNKAQILCNLTKYDNQSNGIEIYTTYHASDCALCNEGSHAIKINGDVFLPENPKIELLSITAKDPPVGMSDFMRQFQSSNVTNEHFVKVNYKENNDPELKYEIYLDMFHVISSIINGTNRYKSFHEKLDDYINQHIPSNTRYFVCLPDEGSIVLAGYILSTIGCNYVQERLPRILKFDETDAISKEDEGSIVIVASCVAKGKNLLYLSRAFRRHDKLKLVYFIGISRMTNDQIQGFLKSNLKHGKYGGETYSYYTIETFNCTNEVKDTAWARERKFLLKFQEFVDDEDLFNEIQTRISYLENSVSRTEKGMANGLFFNSVFDGAPLHLRKNYAFLKYTEYHGNVSQADVYFTVNAIVHKLRNNKSSPKLQQTEYVRILLDPLNFNRFNDGIIQASFLRSCNINELCYHIYPPASFEIMGILETLIKYHNSEQGEALLEFLYALACGQMTMKDEHLQNVAYLAKKSVCQNNKLAHYLVKYIEEEVLYDYGAYISQKGLIQKQAEEIRKLKEENLKLKGNKQPK